MSKKLSKEEVKGPDAFIAFTDRVIKQFEKYSKPITVAFLIAAASGAAIIGVAQYKKHSEKKALTALYKIESQENEINESITTAEREVDFDKDFGPLINNYKNFIQNNAGSKASFIAAINAASLLQEHEKYAEANEVLNLVKSNVSQDNFFYGMIYSQLGSIEMSNKQFQQAIKTFTELTNNPHQTHVHPDATLKLAIAYQEAGEKDKSMEQLRKLRDNFAETNAAQKAISFIRLFSLGE